MNNSFITMLKKEVWAMEHKTLSAFIARFADNKFIVPQGVILNRQERKLSRSGNNATIEIKGILLKEFDAFLAWFGIEQTVYSDIRGQLAEALSDNQIDSILLNIDSPGGTVAGGIETMEAIKAAAGQKKVTAHIQDLGASGAYFLASQASKISAGKNAEVGSMGVFAVVDDYSGLYEKAGVKVNVIRSGEHKGMGVTGAPVTDNQLAALQDIVNGMAENLVSMAASSRGWTSEKSKELATGRTWIAGEAKKLGLIDELINMPAGGAGSNISGKKDSESKNINNSKGTDMAEQDKQTEPAATKVTAPEPAAAKTDDQAERIKAFREAFAEDPAFAIEQLEKGATIKEAKAEYCDVLKEKIKSGGTKKEAAGAEPLRHGEPAAGGDGDFLEQAKMLAKEEKISVTEAMKKLSAENQQLYADYLEKCRGRGKRKK